MPATGVVAGRSGSKFDESAQNTATFNVGTRKSKLALKQTELVIAEALKAFPQYQFNVRARDTAAGDIDKVTAFKDMAVKNIWTHELETLMIEKELDILVHALKDVPTQLPANCEIGGVLPREPPADALVLKAGRPVCKISDLPPGSVIGTSSIRRTAQLALRFPHLVVKDLRGNLPTRLRKLDDEDSGFDAILLGAAGLLRLDLGHRITQYLSSKECGIMHAVGQGAIGIENRSDDATVKRIIDKINDKPTFLAITAERSLLRAIEGGCSAPLGVETQWDTDHRLSLRAILISIDGKDYAEVKEVTAQVSTQEDAEKLGEEAAIELLRDGGDKILAEIKAKKPTTAADLEEN